MNDLLWDVWITFRPVAVIFVFLGVAYFAEKTFHNTVKDLFHGFIGEVDAFTKNDRSERAINMLFGLFGFIAILLLIAAVAVSSLFSTVQPTHHLINVPGDMIILSAFFLLIVFFILSLAYCNKIKN